MRLVNTSTIKLEDFLADEIPPYAILSHTWGRDEVDFQAFQQKKYRGDGTGWGKIVNCCKRAKRNGLQYAWIDTCCIDKTSSAELQEAINSMFRYYQNAAACYAILSDVQDPNNMDQFRTSRWFRRGWTLQELLAPKEVFFFANSRSPNTRVSHSHERSDSWSKIGRRGRNLSSQARDLEADVLALIISEITTINVGFLTGLRPLSDGSIAMRMAWAAGRQTTRIEDRAYSMLGIFDINMPMLYGEGRRAFQRLQREIMAVSDDETILAWHYNLPFGQCVHEGIFAESPDCYITCAELVPIPSSIISRKHYAITNKGLRMKGSVRQCPCDGTWLISLNCTTQSELSDIMSSAYEGHPLFEEERIRPLALCLTTAGNSMSHTWRQSISRPFQADAGALVNFLTRAQIRSLETGPDHQSSFYISLYQPALKTLPFVMMLESSVLRSLKESAGYELIDIEPAFAAQVVEGIDKDDCDKFMMDIVHVKDIDMSVFFYYRANRSPRRYATQLRIKIKRTEILSAETAALLRTPNICETVLTSPHVSMETCLINGDVTREQIFSSNFWSEGERVSSGVAFQVKVLTYKGTIAYTLGHT